MKTLDWIEYVVLPVLSIVLALAVGAILRRAWAFLNAPPPTGPGNPQSWQFEGHPRDAGRSLWWIGVGLGYFLVSAMLLLLLMDKDSQRLHMEDAKAIVAMVIGPIMGAGFCVVGLVIWFVTAVRFRLWGHLAALAVVAAVVGGTCYHFLR